MKELTVRQREVLDYLSREVATHGTAPTYREIAASLGFQSPRAAVDHVKALARKGYLQLHRRRSRGIELRQSQHGDADDVVSIPFLGRIAAGRAVEATEDKGECVKVDRTMLGAAARGRLFALHVTGDSMAGRGIYAGDIVVADADAPPRIGDIVVALIDQESTIKTLAQGKEGKYLKAENPRYPDLAPVIEMDIQGVVRTLIRKVD